jgi:hypothetical protein
VRAARITTAHAHHATPLTQRVDESVLFSAGFAKRLGATKGWKTTPIKYTEHLEYAGLNDLSSDKELGL